MIKTRSETEETVIFQTSNMCIAGRKFVRDFGLAILIASHFLLGY